VTRIGQIVAGAPRVRVLDADGRERRVAGFGFDHFAQGGGT
jgi:hypothetical protein